MNYKDLPGVTTTPSSLSIAQIPCVTYKPQVIPSLPSQSNDRIFNSAVNNSNYVHYLNVYPTEIDLHRVHKDDIHNVAMDSLNTLKPVPLARYSSPGEYVKGYYDMSFYDMEKNLQAFRGSVPKAIESSEKNRFKYPFLDVPEDVCKKSDNDGKKKIIDTLTVNIDGLHSSNRTNLMRDINGEVMDNVMNSIINTSTLADNIKEISIEASIVDKEHLARVSKIHDPNRYELDNRHSYLQPIDSGNGIEISNPLSPLNQKMLYDAFNPYAELAHQTYGTVSSSNVPLYPEIYPYVMKDKVSNTWPKSRNDTVEEETVRYVPKDMIMLNNEEKRNSNTSVNTYGKTSVNTYANTNDNTSVNTYGNIALSPSMPTVSATKVMKSVRESYVSPSTILKQPRVSVPHATNVLEAGQTDTVSPSTMLKQPRVSVPHATNVLEAGQTDTVSPSTMLKQPRVSVPYATNVLEAGQKDAYTSNIKQLNAKKKNIKLGRVHVNVKTPKSLHNRERFENPIEKEADYMYMEVLKTRAMAVCNYLKSNKMYKNWSSNWKLLQKNLNRNGLLFERLDDTDADIAYVINKGDEVKFRIRDVSKYVPINIYQYVLYHEMAHMSTTELQHTAKFHELLNIITLAGFELGFIDLRRTNRDFYYTNDQPIVSKDGMKDEIISGCMFLKEANPDNALYYDSIIKHVNSM